MIEVLAVWKLFQFFIYEKIAQTDTTPREAHVSMHGTEVYSFNLLELSLVQPPLHEIQAVLIQSLDSLLSLLSLLLDISLCVFV